MIYRGHYPIIIAYLASLIKEVTGFQAVASKPDGTPMKLLNIDRINKLGWAPQIPLKQGLQSAYQWFLDNQETYRRA